MSNGIEPLFIKDLLNTQAQYLIPMYQRNYAWEEAEITQLIQDVIDYLPGGKNYYIGTLVVFKRDRDSQVIYETIDGQQRLTTLSLLASYLKNEGSVDVSWFDRLSLCFESRPQSQATFEAVFRDTFENDPTEVLPSEKINIAIVNGYRLINKVLPQKLREYGLDTKQFADYLFSKVQIMRVEVPADTDLNHYFEIMNNRGEQLEKHEVLKSRLMEVLNDIGDDRECKAAQACLHAVWEACANMERYVQMGFSVEQRDALFGRKKWSRFNVADFDELSDLLDTSSVKVTVGSVSQSLNDIVEQATVKESEEKTEDESPERFNTVINFPNFLLHVLRVATGKDIPLDDKRLIATFEEQIINSDKAIDNVKHFTFSLLKCKYLFDQYVIKREFIKGTDGWSLKRMKWNKGGRSSRSGRANYVNTFGSENNDDDENRSLLMLLSAFHVSTPTMVYKHWLNAALYWLYENSKSASDAIDGSDYLVYLESVASAFVFDRFLAPDEKASDYYNIIFRNNGICQTHVNDILDETIRLKLSFGNIENNLVFNYLDYLLWQTYKESENIIRDYEFSFRSSVEHYYPQKPLPGHDQLPKQVVDSFGNLCLISHSKNSRLSNFMPEAKKEYYRNNTIDSVKQYLMMKIDTWNEEAIAEHYDAMKQVLLESLESGYG